MLSDRGNQVARRFGLVFQVTDGVKAIYQEKFKIDLAAVNGDDSWTLPMPGRFVIDRSGTILAVETDPDYTHRPEPAATVEALRTLGG